MPLYDYDCAACGRRFEVVHGIHDKGPATCPLCGAGPVRKAFAAPAVHFKGSGWAKKERRATAAPGTSKSGARTPGAESSGADAGETTAKKSEGSTSETGGTSTTEAGTKASSTQD